MEPTALRAGMEQSWQILKCAFHRVQELSVPICKKPGKERQAWLSKDLLAKLKDKKEIHRQGSRKRYPGKSMGTLLSCDRIGLGRPRCG